MHVHRVVHIYYVKVKVFLCPKWAQFDTGCEYVLC